MKAGVFKLNMHPKEYFDRNPFYDDSKGGTRRDHDKERSKSAPSTGKPFKCSSPGKSVCSHSLSMASNISYWSILSMHRLLETRMDVSRSFRSAAKRIHMLSTRSVHQLRSRPTNSIIDQNTHLKITRSNYMHASASYTSFCE
jgi:hypothetical protein